MGDKGEQFQPESRSEWRDWLQANHATSDGIWLVSYKKSAGKPRVSYDEAVEEALCFGWIDSRQNSLDEARSMLWFSPRRPGSAWSTLNKRRIAGLIDKGLMTAAGMEKIEAARKDGSWNIFDALEALEIPDDLSAALAENPAAQEHFNAFSELFNEADPIVDLERKTPGNKKQANSGNGSARG